MDKILPGIYVGSIKDSLDKEQLKQNNITHILSIHENPKERAIENVKYMCHVAGDNASQDIKKFFKESIHFIHEARVNNGNVLVHCLAGISRSTSLVIAYIMTITEMPWYDCLNAVRAARKHANPNFGFQRQLQNFEYTTIKVIRQELYTTFGQYDNQMDVIHCKALLEQYKQTQQEYVKNTSNQQQVNSNPIKTYPLPFNAYNLDEEKPSSSTSSVNSSLKAEEKPEEKLSEQEKQIEKDKIIDKIFGQ